MKTRMKTTEWFAHPPGESSDSPNSQLRTPKKKSKFMDEHLESHNRLHMLAAVASQHLHSDPTMKTSPNNNNICSPPKPESPSTVCKYSSGSSAHLPNKRKRTPCRKLGDGDLLSLEQIRELSAHHLLKCFSDFDGNELKRTFTYSCVLDPTRCQRKFSSFGSELKARQQMKIHLLEHVNKLSEEALTGIHFKAETVQSRQRRKVDAANLLSKKKKTTFKSITQPLKMSCNVKEEVKQKSTPNSTRVLCSNSIAKESNSESRQPIGATHLLGVLKEKPIKTESVSQGSGSTVSESPFRAIKTEVDDLLSDDSLEPFVKTEDPVALIDHNYVQHGNGLILSEMKGHGVTLNKSQEWHCDRNESLLKSAIRTGTEEKSKYTSPELNKFMVSETLHNMIMVCVLEEEKLQLKQLPCVGSEMDVKTGQVKEAPPKKVNESESEEESSREIKVIHNNIERDEYRLKKKPKGKAKFIGQSKAEKEMAIQMIEAIKSRVTTLESLECQICNPPRSFTAPTTLISHYRSHAGIKPYECRLCRSVFTRQHSLNYHMLIHSNQTRFTCTDCGRKFRHPSHFKEHRRRHTGESPYECSDCMYRFKTRNTYKRHMRTHHGKMLTPSGELLVLSDDEFKQVRALPRHVPGKTTARIISRGRNSDCSRSKAAQNERDNCEEEDDMDFASQESDSSEANSDSNHQDDMSTPFEEAENGVFLKESNKENNIKVEGKETSGMRQYSSVECKANGGARKGFFKDIVKEAMRQSDIPFSTELKSCDNETIVSEQIDFSVTEVIDSCENSYFDNISIKTEDTNDDNVEQADGQDANVEEKQESPPSKFVPLEKNDGDTMGCIYLSPDECVTLNNQGVEVVCGTSLEGPSSETGFTKVEGAGNTQQKGKSTMFLLKPVVVNQEGRNSQRPMVRNNPMSSSGRVIPQPVSILTCQPVNEVMSETRTTESSTKKFFIRAESTLIGALKNQTLMLMNDDSNPEISFCPMSNHSVSVKNGIYPGETTQL